MTKNKTYERKYADIKRKLHAVVYGSSEYKAMMQLLNYYYEKKRA